VVHWLYVSIIRPSITFASLVWWPGCQMANAKKRLRRVQRFACLGIAGAMCTTPTSATEALTCLPPLELQVQLHIVSGAWDVGLTFTPLEDVVAYWYSFSSRIPYVIWGSMLWGQHLILNQNIGLLYWLEKSGPEDLESSCSQKGSSGLQMGTGWRMGLGLDSMGNLWEEGSVGKYDTVF